jgi:hypothetical protein
MAIAKKTLKKVHKKPTIRIIKGEHDKPDMAISKKPITIGLAYSNRCGYCEAMKPDWETMTTRVRSDPDLNSLVNIMKIEKDEPDYSEKLAEINSDLVECKPIVVNGYPTMFCKKEHFVKPYNGDRSADALTEWVRNAALRGQLGGKKTKKGAKRSGAKRSSHKRSGAKRNNPLSFLNLFSFKTPTK